MSKYNLSGSNITAANNIHIGDIYNYSSSQDFVERNGDLKFSETEKELVKIIFDKTESEQERISILSSLKAIKNNEETVDEKRKSILIFLPFLERLKGIGEKVFVDVVAKNLIDYASRYRFSDIIDSIKNIVNSF